MEQQENGTGIMDIVRQRIDKTREWITPDPADPPLLQLLKFTGKSVVLFVLFVLSVVLSPVVLLVLLVAFMAAF